MVATRRDTNLCQDATGQLLGFKTSQSVTRPRRKALKCFVCVCVWAAGRLIYGRPDLQNNTKLWPQQLH